METVPPRGQYEVSLRDIAKEIKLYLLLATANIIDHPFVVIYRFLARDINWDTVYCS
jgi:hypothetical protein